jgi:beta-glucosidase
VPIRSLQGIKRIHLAPGERSVVSFTLEPRQLAIVADSGANVVEPGEFSVAVGGKQPGFVGRADAATTSVVDGRFRVTGKATVIRIEADR